MKKIFLFAFLIGVSWMGFWVAAHAPIPGVSALLPWNRADAHPDQVKGKKKIPIDPARWYQLNHTATGLQALFDGVTDRKVETGYGKVLHRYEAYYPLLEGEQMTIEQVLLYDGEGTSDQQPFTLSVIDERWQRLTIATFTGDKYQSWVGPGGGTRDFNLPLPLANARYLVISTPSFYPTEMELYGSYQAPKAGASPGSAALARQKQVPLKHTAGINAFEWDFEDAARPDVIDEVRWEAVRSFSGVRHYLDWEKLEPRPGEYTFNPVHAGGWNYDAIYARCRAAGVEVLACLKTLPPWMLATYPPDQQDQENVPVKYGKDFSDPASYREQARAAFQFAARYGRNKAVAPALVKVSKSTRWKGDAVNQVKIGLGLVRYLECDNERDKWWKGRQAYQTGREYAANLSAFYDGHRNSLGPGVGVKNADPTMLVVMGGLARPSTDYIRGMIDWCKQYRGYKPDGRVDLCWDVINFHLYAHDGGSSQEGQPTRGAAPEVAGAGQVARDFVRLAHQYARDMPVWVTETGYDLHPDSPLRAIPIKGKPAALTQADWILRSALLYARCGVERVFFYQLADDNASSGGRFSSSGLVTAGRRRRPAADYLYQMNQLLGDYAYQQTLASDPLVDRYACQGKSVYAVVVPDEKGRKAQVTLDLGRAAYAYVYRPQAGQNHMSREKHPTQQGRLTLTATETPAFVSVEAL